MNELLLKAKKFPLSSGVYFFIDSKGTILYIGRAVSLRKRILNYFQKKIVSGKTYDYKSTILFKIYSLNTISMHITAAIIN